MRHIQCLILLLDKHRLTLHICQGYVNIHIQVAAARIYAAIIDGELNRSVVNIVAAGGTGNISRGDDRGKMGLENRSFNLKDWRRRTRMLLYQSMIIKVAGAR
jgi:hypothetical protein